MEGDNKFINKYRIDSTRLPGWNYGDDGYYFVTICTKNRVEHFGGVLMDNNGEYSVALTDVGKIVRDELLKTPRIRPNVKLDEWIIMPNHVHAIIVIDNNTRRDGRGAASHSTHKMSLSRGYNETPMAMNNVYGNNNGFGYGETPQRGRLYNNGERGFRHDWHKNEWQPNSLGSIINQFKSVCTKQIRKINPSFAWQTRFYDRIIRDERVLYAVRHYMKNNPKNWARDRNNPANLWI